MTVTRVRNSVNVSGKQLVDMARDMFKTASPSIVQIQYVMNMLQPTSYLLQHHTVKGHPITYTIPNRDTTRAFSHRPWQIDVINDQYKEKTIIKSRQLGLTI